MKNILLFGIPNVGKTTTGKVLAERLGYRFYDLSEEIRKGLHMSQQQIADTYWLVDGRDRLKKEYLGKVLSYNGNKVIAVPVIYYSRCYTCYLKSDDVFPIELRDTPENIFERLVFSDENDNVYHDDAYKNRYKKHYLNEIKKDITCYKNSFSHIPNKLDMNNDSPETVADRLISKFHLES